MSKSPDAFRTIREVADWLGVAAHVLRFWESKFTQINPVKRAGGRRYYRPADMELVGGIKVLLHDRGMTVRGVQRMLREEGVATVAALSPPLDAIAVPSELLEGIADEAAWHEDAPPRRAKPPKRPNCPRRPWRTPDRTG
jgi:DNA-binding transcriptional MerR regulator